MLLPIGLPIGLIVVMTQAMTRKFGLFSCKGVLHDVEEIRIRRIASPANSHASGAIIIHTKNQALQVKERAAIGSTISIKGVI
jgi:hypothetical protein